MSSLGDTLPFIPPLFPFASFSYGVVMPARCHAHSVDSPLVCASHEFTAVEREAAIHVLRCESHAAESPLACHALYHRPEPRHSFQPRLT